MRIGGVVLVVGVLLGGCATRRLPAAPLVPAQGTGGAGAFSEQGADLFQELQEASGLEPAARHPAGAALYVEQARQGLEQLARAPVTQSNAAAQRALSWLLLGVLEGGERVEYADLQWRAERFESLVWVRPDGYLVAALTGTPLQRLGPLELVEGEWKVGRLRVGDFYFSKAGVFYSVNEALRRAEGPPLAELGLGRDPLNAALDGAQEAWVEMELALAGSILHPIRSVKELAQLPATLALLIASSPEYFARYGAMSREDQIREAARLSTHVLLMLGGGEAAAGRMGGLGAELPVVSLTAKGELVMGRALVSGGAVAELGAFSVLHMASSGKGGTGGPSGKAGKPPQKASTQGPGRWVYKKPTNQSKASLDYQEQVTGRPAWWVYMIGKLEFDGFKAKELLEAKGPGYCAFFNADGTPKYWYKNSGKFNEMIEQARRHSEEAKQLGLPVTWHVADVEVVKVLRQIFKEEKLNNITVQYTEPIRQ